MRRAQLRKSNVIVFAGAGASARLGMPTTPQFVRMLDTVWPGSKTLIQQCKKYRQISDDARKDNSLVDAEELRDWLLGLEPGAENLDVLFANPPYDMGPKRPKINVVAHDFVKQILAAFDEIVRTKYGVVDPQRAYNHYSVFFNALLEYGIRTVPFCTTNYDLVIESLGNHSGFKSKWWIERGLEIEGTSAVLNMNRFKDTSYGRPTINLFKLHGSTDWWLNADNNQTEFISFGSKPPPNYDQLLIYPTKEKFEQVSEQPFSLFYDKLKKYLSSKAVHTCIVIGYSFRDIKINKLFIPAIKRGLRLLVFDNDTTVISQQVREAFPSINVDKQMRTLQLDFGIWNVNNRTSLIAALNDELGKASQ